MSIGEIVVGFMVAYLILLLVCWVIDLLVCWVIDRRRL